MTLYFGYFGFYYGEMLRLLVNKILCSFYDYVDTFVSTAALCLDVIELKVFVYALE